MVDIGGQLKIEKFAQTIEQIKQSNNLLNAEAYLSKTYN